MNQSIPQESRCASSVQGEVALERWNGEGGAGPGGRQGDAATGNGSHEPLYASAELAQLRIRVIALENLVITLLAEGPAQQLRLARSMAIHVSPRPGFTHHRPTLHAATQMRHLIKRAAFFRAATQRNLPGE
jgi:hypothetical protein